jgi:hypothetical protein
VSGSRVTFIGDAMAAVVQGVAEVHTLIGQPPVVVGGLAVMDPLRQPCGRRITNQLIRASGGPGQDVILRPAHKKRPLRKRKGRRAMGGSPWRGMR